MWLLEVYSRKDSSTFGGSKALSSRLYVLNGPTCIVGRLQENDIFVDENSVSRKHLQVDLGDKDALTITDLKSKFKTTLVEDGSSSNVKIEPKSLNPDEPHPVSVGSVFRIGSFTYIKFTKTSSLTVSCTRLEKPEKDLLKLRLKKLGAKFTDKLTKDCHFMVSNRYFATVKILSALVYSNPIVNPQYFEVFDQIKGESGSGTSTAGNLAAQSVIAIPPVTNFLPLTDEHDINDASQQRMSLFSGLTVYIQENEEDYSNLLKGCGARLVPVNNDQFAYEHLLKSIETSGGLQSSHMSTIGGEAHKSICIFFNESINNERLLQNASTFLSNALNWLTSSNLAMSIIKCTKPVLTSTIPSTSSASQLQQPINTTSRHGSILAVSVNDDSIGKGLLGGKRVNDSSKSGVIESEEISPDILKVESSINSTAKTAKTPSTETLVSSKKHKPEETFTVLANDNDDLFEEDQRAQDLASRSSKKVNLKPIVDKSTADITKNTDFDLSKDKVLGNSKKVKHDSEILTEKSALADVSVKVMPSSAELNLQLDSHFVQSPDLEKRPTRGIPSLDSNSKFDLHRSIADTRASTLYKSDGQCAAPSGWSSMPRGSERSKIIDKLKSSNSIDSSDDYDESKTSSNVKSEAALSLEVDLLSTSQSSIARQTKRTKEGSDIASNNFRDKRVFTKNRVKNVTDGIVNVNKINPINVSYDPVYALENMTIVLPKETEREIQLRLDYEKFRNRTIEKEKLFSDRLIGTQRKNR